jgi:hypothetical protein
MEIEEARSKLKVRNLNEIIAWLFLQSLQLQMQVTLADISNRENVRSRVPLYLACFYKLDSSGTVTLLWK